MTNFHRLSICVSYMFIYKPYMIHVSYITIYKACSFIYEHIWFIFHGNRLFFKILCVEKEIYVNALLI